MQGVLPGIAVALGRTVRICREKNPRLSFQCLQTSTLSVDKSWDNLKGAGLRTAKCLPRQQIDQILTSSGSRAIGMKTSTNQAIDSLMYVAQHLPDNYETCQAPVVASGHARAFS
jgi:hypothetical protein